MGISSENPGLMGKLKTTDEIKLDIDEKTMPWARLEVAVQMLSRMGLRFSSAVVARMEGDSGFRGFHVRIGVGSLAEIYVPFVQVVLGSDYKREIFNMERVINSEVDWNILFREKHKGHDRVSWETPARAETRKLRGLIEKCR